MEELFLGGGAGQPRKWEASGELLPARKTRGGTRYYATSEILDHQAAVADPLTVCYARVSSHDQKADLDRQHATLEAIAGSRNTHGKNNQSNRREWLYDKRRRIHARIVNVRNDTHR